MSGDVSRGHNLKREQLLGLSGAGPGQLLSTLPCIGHAPIMKDCVAPTVHRAKAGVEG